MPTLDGIAVGIGFVIMIVFGLWAIWNLPTLLEADTPLTEMPSVYTPSSTIVKSGILDKAVYQQVEDNIIIDDTDINLIPSTRVIISFTDNLNDEIIYDVAQGQWDLIQDAYEQKQPVTFTCSNQDGVLHLQQLNTNEQPPEFDLTKPIQEESKGFDVIPYIPFFISLVACCISVYGLYRAQHNLHELEETESQYRREIRNLQNENRRLITQSSYQKESKPKKTKDKKDVVQPAVKPVSSRIEKAQQILQNKEEKNETKTN